jgi:hypothetical protein
LSEDEHFGGEPPAGQPDFSSDREALTALAGILDAGFEIDLVSVVMPSAVKCGTLAVAGILVAVAILVFRKDPPPASEPGTSPPPVVRSPAKNPVSAMPVSRTTIRGQPAVTRERTDVNR